MVFRLDEAKRVYKNEDQESFRNWFLDNFNPEEGSIWFAKYKFDDLPSVGFVLNNQVNGYFQQMDNKLHRSCFGQGVYKDGCLTFVWIVSVGNDLLVTTRRDKGNPEIPTEMKEGPVYSSCEWTLIDDPVDRRIWDHFYPGEDTRSYLFL